MKLNLECRYLSALLLDKFAVKNNIPTHKADLYSAATLLVAAKMREVDTKTPFLSEIKRFEPAYWNFNELKQVEIELGEFFEWNLCFYTFFDYIEHFTNIGLLYSSDIVNPTNSKTKNILGNLPNFNNFEPVAFTTPEDRLANRPVLFSGELDVSAKKNSDGFTETTKDDFDGDGVSIGISDNDFSAKKQLWGSSGKKKNSGNTMSPDGQKIMTVNRFDQRIQRSLAHKMEDRCFELAKRVLDDIPLNTFRQLHMAFAIVKFVRREFGLSNKVFDEDEFLEEVFQIASFDYNHELELLRHRYQKSPDNFACRTSNAPTAYEVLSKNKPKSMMKISPRKATVNQQSGFGKNLQQIPSISSNNRSVPRIRQNSSSIILDIANDDLGNNNPQPVNIASLNNIVSDNGSKIAAENYNTKQCSKDNIIFTNENDFATSHGNSKGGNVIKSQVSLTNRQGETNKNVEKLIFDTEENNSIGYSNNHSNIAQVQLPGGASINCRFRTHNLKDENSCNNNILFNANITKPRLTVADLYLKAPQFNQPSTTTHQGENVYINQAPIMSGNVGASNIKRTYCHSKNTSHTYTSNKPYSSYNNLVTESNQSGSNNNVQNQGSKNFVSYSNINISTNTSSGNNFGPKKYYTKNNLVGRTSYSALNGNYASNDNLSEQKNWNFNDYKTTKRNMNI